MKFNFGFHNAQDFQLQVVWLTIYRTLVNNTLFSTRHITKPIDKKKEANNSISESKFKNSFENK